ncbi:hypothetical protein BG015_008904 [Linnemannia schmuckeri]|uniref:F-box domain-containing protein n=1 Tax=Linnemannia schmuckeri TaxID=64567 RepID=A0A9P5VAB7_9FUNG|nr:hypothetical protein BG015_008904 [Linnemannia schmuckeri]
MWLARLNATTLTHLDITELSLLCVHVVKDISRTILQLPCLKVLHLRTQAGHLLTRHAFESLSYSCPASLVDLELGDQIYGQVIRCSRDPVMDD